MAQALEVSKHCQGQLVGGEVDSEKLLGRWKLHGPYGGNGGTYWDDGKPHYGVHKIFLSHKKGKNGAIGNFTVTYKDGTTTVHKSGHITYKQETIELHLDEFIKEMSGYTGAVGGTEVVRYLKFETNKGRVYEFGVKEGKHFSTPPLSGIAGFVGRTSGDYLNAIGLYENLKI